VAQLVESLANLTLLGICLESPLLLPL